MADLEEIFANKEKETPPPASEPEKTQEEKNADEEVLKKQIELQNLEKARIEALDELRKIRKQIQESKKPITDDEELPKIDMQDPNSKAWDKHMQDKVNPLQAELEREKEEIRSFALKQFLAERPELATKPEKLKSVMITYDKIKNATERTVEGVLTDLDRAYAAESHEDLLAAAGQRSLNKAKAEEAFSGIAVSRGATAYSSGRDSSKIPLSEDDKEQLRKWGMTETQWQESKKKHV